MSDPIVSMVRNGYARRADGSFMKLILCPRSRCKNDTTHSTIERVIRNSLGRLVRVETHNRRRGPEPRMVTL